MFVSPSVSGIYADTDRKQGLRHRWRTWKLKRVFTLFWIWKHRGIAACLLYLNDCSCMEIKVIYFMLQFGNRCHIKQNASKSFDFENTHYQRERLGILFLRLEYILLNDIHNEFIICIWATSSLLWCLPNGPGVISKTCRHFLASLTPKCILNIIPGNAII